MKYWLLLLSFFATTQLCMAQTNSELTSMLDVAEDYISLGDYEAAMQQVDKILEINGSHLKATATKIDLYLLTGDYKKADKLAEEALERFGNSAIILLEKGKASIRRGKNKDAIEELSDALSESGSDRELQSKIFVNRGAAYQKLQRFNEAMEDYSSAIDLNSTNPNVYMYRGVIYYSQTDYMEAISDFDQVIEIDPQNPFAFYNRGMAYFKLQKFEEACDDFHKACELGNTSACRMIVNHCIEINRNR